MADTLVQTRVPNKTGRLVLQKASAEGLSVAAWLRRLIIKEVGSMQVEAWMVPRDEANPSTSVTASNILEHIRDISGAEVVFGLLHGPVPGKLRELPVSPEVARDLDWFRHQDQFQVLLKGSPRPWSIVRTMYDSNSERIELVLRVD